jgi:uncharacterized protein (DUF302 family)
VARAGLSAPAAFFDSEFEAVWKVQSLEPVQARHQMVDQHSHRKGQAAARGIHCIDRHLQPARTASLNAIRVKINTPLSFDELLARLRNVARNASPREITELAAHVDSWEEFARLVNERFVGESGFMLFADIDHGAWVSRAGIHWRTVRWILGNPLLAITMMRHDLDAGLFAPVELLMTEHSQGTTPLYVRPSSLIFVPGGSAELKAAAEELDQKFEALVRA